MNYADLVAVAGGKQPASMVVVNGRIVNVFSREIYEGGVAIWQDRTAAVGDVDYAIGPQTKIVDAAGCFVTPGLIDGHVHVESSMLSATRFAEVALLHGTTSVMSDLHEVAVVGGLEAVYAVLAEVERTPFKLYWVIPSHVPFSPGFETTGGEVGPEEVRQALQHHRAVGLSEVVVTSALEGEARLAASMQIVREAGGLLHGHGPFTYGPDLAAFASLGIRTDHESFNEADALARLRTGIHLQIRDGSAAHSLPDLIGVLTTHHLDSRHVSMITDDVLAEDLLKTGYMDHLVRGAQQRGVDALTAIQMASINAAEAFRVDHEIGVLAPGRYADVLIVEQLDTFNVQKVIANGQLVVEDNELTATLPPPEPNPVLVNTMNWTGPVTASDLAVTAGRNVPGQLVAVRVMAIPPDLPVPDMEICHVPVVAGSPQPDPSQDVAAICVVERHKRSGNMAVSFVRGFHLADGAMASSVAHDHHNIVALGTSYDDLAVAINRIGELGGGQVVVQQGNVLAEVKLPILGLMSPQPVQEVCIDLENLTRAARQIGCDLRWPLMFLSFMTCSGGPGYSITDRGLLDGYEQRLLPAVAEEQGAA